jgi:L-2-hydroxyglutarate oxidase LhgO
MDRFEPPPRESDFTVVGGGIVGLAVARQILSDNPGARLAVVEVEDRLAAHQTSHSSGVIHAGVYYEPGSLKARLCREGRNALFEYCDERAIPYEKNGKLIVATRESEIPALDRLETRARENGVPGLTRLGPEEIGTVEPHARGVAAIHSPETGVIEFGAVAARLADDVEGLGGSIHLSSPVVAAALTSRPDGSERLVLTTARGPNVTRRAVFCAGLQADRLARMCGLEGGPRIVPFRGGYLRVTPGKTHLVRGNIYPVPDPDLPFLGAHLTRTSDGSVLIGPTAMPALDRHGYRLRSFDRRDALESAGWPGTWRLIARHPRATAKEALHSTVPRSLVSEARRMLPGLSPKDVTRGPAGVRAQALDRDGSLVDDFLLERTDCAIHLLNAPSPAATSALALARLITGRLQDREAGPAAN